MFQVRPPSRNGGYLNDQLRSNVAQLRPPFSPECLESLATGISVGETKGAGIQEQQFKAGGAHACIQ
jgi:hypothetical protein